MLRLASIRKPSCYESMSDIPCNFALSALELVVKPEKTSTNTVTEGENGAKRQPILIGFGDLGAVLGEESVRAEFSTCLKTHA